MQQIPPITDFRIRAEITFNPVPRNRMIKECFIKNEFRITIYLLLHPGHDGKKLGNRTLAAGLLSAEQRDLGELKPSAILRQARLDWPELFYIQFAHGLCIIPHLIDTFN